MKQAVKTMNPNIMGYMKSVTESKLHRFTVEAKDIEEAKESFCGLCSRMGWLCRI